MSDRGVGRSVDRGADAIRRATGLVPTCMRPPGGAISRRVTAVVESHDHRVVMWDRDSGDWAHQSSQALLSRSRRWEAGEVVLMHDTNGYLYDDGILEDLIAEVRSRGLGFSTLCANHAPPPRPEAR
jgi:peptidoglycan/xylan/chitin deacetylase (PgdA/CDA1 family)